MAETLTLWSPYKLLKNLGALSEYAKCSQSSTKIKNEILTLDPGYDGGMVKKTSHATVPLKGPMYEIFFAEIFINLVWVDDLRTTQDNLKLLCLSLKFAILLL